MDTQSTERKILTDFFKALNGENWRRHPNWLSKEPVGGWHGIRTNQNGRVIAIELGGNRLRGSIPGDLGGLSELRSLQLFDNQITGPIPPELGDLPKLGSLSLYRNRLSGPIPPELGNMTRLHELLAHNNALSGRIPDELCGATNLSWLSLANNRLDGPLPDVGALRKLRAFLVSRNACLYGDLPQGLTDLPLEQIAFDGTQLRAPSQSFRDWLAGPNITNHTGLEWNATTDREALVELFQATRGPEWRNKTGWLSERPLGEWAGVDTNADGRVVRLLLGGNGLVGALPCRLGTLTALKDMRLDHNRLEGVPAALGSLVNLEMLNLSYSAMKGEIPPQLGRLRKLKTLDLRDNLLTSSIPAELGDMAELKVLHLYSNRLTGPIPRTLGNLRHLVRMVLSLNRLSGRIPEEFRQLKNLQVMALNNNRLSGQIPASLGLMSSLVRLNLSNNKFSGRVPAAIGSLDQLKVLAVSGNSDLAGALRKSYKGLKNLELFYFDETGLCQPEDLKGWLARVPKLRGTRDCEFYEETRD